MKLAKFWQSFSILLIFIDNNFTQIFADEGRRFTQIKKNKGILFAKICG